MKASKMSAGAKLFLGLFAGFMVLSVVTVAAGAAAVASAGSVSVEVQPDDGDGLSLGLPAILIHLAIALAPDDFVAECAGELEPVWPTLSAAARELDRAPDFVLLEVRSRDEYVRVEKRQGRMIVLVESGDEQVSVALPMGTVRHLARRLEAQAHTG